MYKNYIKRLLDFCLSLSALVVLLPFLIVFMIIGAIKMKGDPFFYQERPGKDEKIFHLYKFRTMTNKKDKNGKLLSDEKRLTKFGRFLRSTSLDELPELFNILFGKMSFIGPRPLLVEYLDYYTEEEHHRHDVTPGLTGWAQANGRNTVDWDDRFKLDLEYVNNLTFKMDLKVIFLTIKEVIKREGISQEGQATMTFLYDVRKKRR